MKLLEPQHADADLDVAIPDVEDEDEDAVGWWQPEEEDSADSDCDGHASTHGDAGGAYAVQWAPPRDTDLRELETGVGEVDGWRCRLEERLAACRRHVDGGREVCEGLAKVSARVKEEADVIRTRERRLNEAVASAGVASSGVLKETMAQLEAATKAHAAAAEAFAAAQRGHDDVAERLSKARDDLESARARMNDASCVMEIRRSIHALKKEIASMELRLGVGIHARQVKSLAKTAEHARRRRFRPIGARGGSESRSRSTSPE